MTINIDGTDISSLTIDGTEVQEVTVDGDVVYTAFSGYEEGFETYADGDSPDGWSTNTGINGEVDSTFSFSGSNSYQLTGDQGGQNYASQNVDLIPSDVTKFEYYYRETSDSQGHMGMLVDQDGDFICGGGSNNPTFHYLDDGGYVDSGLSPSSQDYRVWIRVTMDNFDFTNRTYDITFEDTSNNDSVFFGNRELDTGSISFPLTLAVYIDDGSGPNQNIDTNVDDFLVLY